MAIYKNREVGVITPNHFNQPPSTIVVRYADGTHENVSLGLVKFTDEEKKALIKNFPSQFDNVTTISEDDLKAVRLGVTPPSDPELKVQAEAKVLRDKMEAETKKNQDKAKADAEKKVDAYVNQSKSAAPVVTPVAPAQTKPLFSAPKAK